MAQTKAKQAENKPEESWADRLRQAITADSRSRYAICKAADIEASVLARFMAGKSINLTTAEKLGRVVGYDLCRKPEYPTRQSGE